MNMTNEEVLVAENAAQESASKIHKYLIFVINDGVSSDLKMGIDAEYVVEILNNYTLTYLPKMPHYFRGIFNMRGQIIPVVDMRMRLDKPVGDKSLLIVLNYNGTELGIIVDTVDRMVDIDIDTITTIRAQDRQRFVSGMCTLPDQTGTMLVLNCDELFAHE